MKYKAGQLVVNTKLGIGKVLEVRGDNVTVFFRDQTDNPRVINIVVVPMALAKEQDDPSFDDPKLLKKQNKAMPVKKRGVRRPAKSKQP